MLKKVYFFKCSLLKYAQPIFLSLVFIFLGLGWAFIVTNPYSSELKCDKNSGYCEIIEYDFFKNIVDTESFHINDIVGLTIQQKQGQTRKRRTYYYEQAYIITKYKKIAVSDTQYNDFNEFYQGNIDEINTSEQQIISFSIGLLGAFLGFIGFIINCKNIKEHYLDLKINVNKLDSETSSE